MQEHATEMSLKKRIVLSDLLSSPYRDVYLQIQNELGRNIHPRQILHHVLVGNNVVPKCPCGNNLAWHADFKRYRDYCSKQCTAKYTTITKKQHRIEQGLSEWHTQTVELWK